MKKKFKILVSLILVSLVVGLLSSSYVEGYIGGHQDDNQDYNCGGSCHSGDANRGAGQIDVWLDKTSVGSGQNLVVMVNVTLVQLGGESSAGVFLLSSQTESNDHPSSQGWKIAQDPNGGSASQGTARNYVEKTSSGSGEIVSFKWILEAPPTEGQYNLFIRVHHGSVANNPLWQDYEGTIDVDVTSIPPGMPEIDHDPISIGYLDEPVVIEASVKNATEVSLQWRLTGEAQFLAVAMTNTSVETEDGWIYEGSIPPQSNKTKLEYKIIASRQTGEGPLVSETSIFTLSIEERPELPDMTAWTLQILVVTEVIVFAVVIAIRLSKPRLKEEDSDV